MICPRSCWPCLSLCSFSPVKHLQEPCVTFIASERLSTTRTAPAEAEFTQASGGRGTGVFEGENQRKLSNQYVEWRWSKPIQFLVQHAERLKLVCCCGHLCLCWKKMVATATWKTILKVSRGISAVFALTIVFWTFAQQDCYDVRLLSIFTLYDMRAWILMRNVTNLVTGWLVSC